MKYRATVENGKIKVSNKEIFEKQVQSLEGLDFLLTIEKIKKQRSLDQNAYYWGVVIDILSKETGYTPEEMHKALKMKFLQSEFTMHYKNYSEHLTGTNSTADLATIEFEKYLNDIRVWATVDLSVFIPLPNEAEDYYNKIS